MQTKNSHTFTYTHSRSLPAVYKEDQMIIVDRVVIKTGPHECLANPATEMLRVWFSQAQVESKFMRDHRS